MFYRTAALAAALFIAGPAAAQDWSGEGELGLSVTTGNTETENLNARLRASRSEGPWTNSGSLELLRESENGETSAERYLLILKSAYDWSERNYGFGSLRYDDDRFSGYQYQVSLTGGVGRHFIRTERTKLDIEFGPGYRASETDDGTTHEEAILHGNLDFTHQLTETTTVLETFLVEAGDANTHVESETGLKVAINSRLAMKTAFKVKHNSEVEPGREKTDTITSVNLVYGF